MRHSFLVYPGHEILGLTQDFKVKSSVLWSSGFPSNVKAVNGYMGLGSNESSECFIDQPYQQNYIQVMIFPLKIVFLIFHLSEKVFSFYFDFINNPRFSHFDWLHP